MLVVIIPKSKVTISNYYGIIITIYNYQAWGLTLKEAVWLDVLLKTWRLHVNKRSFFNVKVTLPGNHCWTINYIVKWYPLTSLYIQKFPIVLLLFDKIYFTIFQVFCEIRLLSLSWNYFVSLDRRSIHHSKGLTLADWYETK